MADRPPGVAGARVNARLAVPLSVMTCGEVGASSVIVSVATLWRAMSGASVRVIEQVAFTG